MAHGVPDPATGDLGSSAGPENRVARLDGLFKEIYADNLENLLPKGLKLQKDIAWIEKSKSPGGSYHQPVLLRHEHGFTYAAAKSGAFPLSKAVPGKTADTEILGTQMMLRSVIDYEVAARASSGGKRAFRRALDIVVENMFASTRKRMEIDYFYGQRSLFEFKSCTVNVADTSSIGTSTERGWAPGIWAGMEGAKVDVGQDTNDTVPAGRGILSQEQKGLSTELWIDTDVEVTEVDLSDRTVVFADGTGNPVEQVTDNAATTTSDWVVWHGAFGADTSASGHPAASVFKGMESIMDPTQDGSTSLFNLPIAGNSLWQGNVKQCVSQASDGADWDAGGVLSFEDIATQIAVASAKGLDENLVLYLNPLVWTDLIVAEQANVQWHNPTGKTLDLGNDDVRFHTANGVVNIKPSNYVKIGLGFMFAPKLWKRIGATDLTFRLPDRGDEFFLHLPEHAGYELRNYVSHALFTKAPAKSILLKNISTSLTPSTT